MPNHTETYHKIGVVDYHRTASTLNFNRTKILRTSMEGNIFDLIFAKMNTNKDDNGNSLEMDSPKSSSLKVDKRTKNELSKDILLVQKKFGFLKLNARRHYRSKPSSAKMPKSCKRHTEN